MERSQVIEPTGDPVVDRPQRGRVEVADDGADPIRIGVDIGQKATHLAMA